MYFTLAEEELPRHSPENHLLYMKGLWDSVGLLSSARSAQYIDFENEPLQLIVFNLVYQVPNTLYSFHKASAYTVLVQSPIVLFAENFPLLY